MKNDYDLLRQDLDKYLVQLDPRMRERFNDALQKALIESLLDGTVFAIIDSLHDLQQMNEMQLYEERRKRLISLQSEPDLDEKMRQIDISIVQKMDEIVAQQQNTLCRAGVPAFRVTTNPREISLQMNILSFVKSVRQKFV